MPASLDISVVVATHNRADRLKQLLEALAAQTLDGSRFEVVVVDDGSRDQTSAVLAAAVERSPLILRTLTQPLAGGPAAARNRGWRAADAPIVAFTDDDCRPVANWLETLLTAQGGRDDYIVQGRTEPDPLEHEHLGPFAKTLHIDGPSPHFQTCNIAYPARILEQVGGFDETFPAPAGEDSDLGWRATDAGAKTGYTPDALVYHAVFPLGPVKTLRGALIATHDVRSYKLNAALRKLLVGGVFYKRSHVLLLEAALGVWLARRQPAAALFTLPWLMHAVARARSTGGSVKDVPFFALYDAVEIAATVRGGVRHRLPVI